MSTIPKFKKQQKEVAEELRKLHQITVVEERDYTEEEAKTFEDLESEFMRLSNSIEREERLASLEGKVLEQKAPVEPTTTRAQSFGKTETAGFSSLGDQISAVIRAGMPGGTIDKRLAQGMNESIPADGGFLVSKEFVNDLVSSAYETGILASRCRRIPIGAGKNGVKLNMIDQTSRANGSRSGGVRAYWAGEAEEITKSKTSIKQLELTLKKLVGMTYLTDELIDDTEALQSWVSQAFSEEMGFTLDDGIMNGTGLGQPLGVLNAPALAVVTKEGSQPNASVHWKNLTNMYSRLLPGSIKNAVWLYNQDVFPALASMQFDAAATAGSVPLFVPANSASGTPHNTILGLPMIPIEHAPSVGAQGDISLVDFSKYLLIDKSPIKATSSIHVRFIYDEMALKFTYRVDGQPLLRSAITPFKGSVTQSAYVALGARVG